jgi:hypothetical protein
MSNIFKECGSGSIVAFFQILIFPNVLVVDSSDAYAEIMMRQTSTILPAVGIPGPEKTNDQQHQSELYQHPMMIIFGTRERTNTSPI